MRPRSPHVPYSPFWAVCPVSTSLEDDSESASALTVMSWPAFEKIDGPVLNVKDASSLSRTEKPRRVTAPSVSWKTCSGGASNSKAYVFGTGCGSRVEGSVRQVSARPLSHSTRIRGTLQCSVAVRGRGRFRRLSPERQLAVDLGTANTVVYQRGRGVVTFEPSVVAIDERSGEVYAVGAEARRMIGRTPAHIKATRPLRHGVIADFDTTEQMLRYFIRTAFHRFGSGAEVMVCIPSGVTQVERTAVEEATLGAGASRAYLIEEPLAAAIGADLPVADPSG